jgi:hypothetical protein|tara:strand:+ start:324 stop:542 length:219 start_codon:yes stop_codon:yes gene_type:complete
MNPPINVTEQEATEHLEFMVSMCDRNRVIWRIEREDGKAVLMAPIAQSGPPVSEDVVTQVEEFRQQFLNENE